MKRKAHDGPCSHKETMVYGARFLPHGDKIIAGGSGGNELRIFERTSVGTNNFRSAAVARYDSSVYSVEWGSVGEHVAAGLSDGTTYVFRGF